MRVEDIENEIKAIPLKKQVVAIAEAVGDKPEYFELLWQIISKDKGLISWRAAWVAENIFHLYPEMIEPYYEKMIDLLHITKDNSLKRHLFKILSLSPIREESMGVLVNLSFDCVADTRLPPAPRAHCMQILFEAAMLQNDMMQEVILVFDDLRFDESSGIKARAQMLAARLKRISAKSIPKHRI